MAPIDCLSWEAGLSLLVFGISFGIRVSDRRVLDHFLDYLPPGWRRAASPSVGRLYSFLLRTDRSRRHDGAVNLLYANADQLARASDIEHVFAVFEADLRLYVAERAHRRVFVHAGVVGWQGEAIVLPGRSFSGKTSLVAALVRAGATYFSDEYAVLDAQGRVHPYARPLSIRQEDGKKMRRCPVDALGGSVGTRPMPVGLVIVTQYRRGATWHPRQLSAGQGTLALLANTVSVRRQPATVLAALRCVVRRASMFEGMRGEAGVTAEKLLDEFDYYRGGAPVKYTAETGYEGR
jgi:hypothetical protein